MSTTKWLPETIIRGAGVSKDDLISQVAQLCKDVFDVEFAPAELEVAMITGGITNLLFKVTAPRLQERLGLCCLLVRVFGENTEVLIDREKDNRVFEQLSEAGFAPRLFAVFGNGRIEEHIPSRTLAPHEMGWRGPDHGTPHDYVDLIAKETARMHLLPMEDPDSTPLLWKFLDKWYGIAASTGFDSSPAAPEVERSKAEKYVALDIPRLGQELEWIKTILPSNKNRDGQDLLDAYAAELSEKYPGDGSRLCTTEVGHYTGDLIVPSAPSPIAQARLDGAAVIFRVVYGHNDLLSGNILHVEVLPQRTPPVYEDRVVIIDYEYGGYNYCGFDFGNHFCEHAGFDFDLDTYYPTRDAQYAWFRSYLRGAGIPIPTAASYGGGGGGGEEDEISRAFLDEMYIRSNHFALASHHWWGLWAIVQARHSPIDFDFMSYSGARFKGYYKHKKEFVGAE